MRGLFAAVAWGVCAGLAAGADKPPAVGADGRAGTLANPRKVDRLIIDKPGVYENYLVDGAAGGGGGNLVKITADGVTLRHCEVRNGSGNAIGVFSRDVVIEDCRLHHMLAGTFKDQHDAHGITGHPTNLVVRNCEVYYFSGDAVQFDPERKPWDNVTLDRCTFWTGPLPADAAGFKKGERPGENALDSKQLASNPRSRIVIRNCLMYGFGKGQISNMAAINIKNNVEAVVENCVLRDNDIALRLRGGEGKYGGAKVTVRSCAVYDSEVGVRIEDGIADLHIERLGFGPGVGKKYTTAGAKPVGYVNTGEFAAPSFEEAVRSGISK